MFDKRLLTDSGHLHSMAQPGMSAPTPCSWHEDSLRRVYRSVLNDRRVAHEVIATAFSDDVAFVRTLGADRVIDVQKSRFDEVLADVDVVLDTIGGDTQDRSFAVLRPGGVLVSVVAAPDPQKAAHHGVQALFFLVEVSSRRLEQIAALIEAGELTTSVGDVLPLSAARLAHEMLAGKPHKRGKIVLTVGGSQ